MRSTLVKTLFLVKFLSKLGDLSNPELRMLTDQLERIRYGGDEAFVKRLSIRGLLPDTDHYMTYDGSTTAPACPETVTWLVLNKPIYITKQQVIEANSMLIYLSQECWEIFLICVITSARRILLCVIYDGILYIFCLCWELLSIYILFEWK